MKRQIFRSCTPRSSSTETEGADETGIIQINRLNFVLDLPKPDFDFRNIQC